MTPEERARRAWPDPPSGTVYGLSMDYIRAITAKAIGEAVDEERTGCAREVCEGCAAGWPLEDRDGDLLHLLPEPLRQPWVYGAGSHTTCDAGPIHARAVALGTPSSVGRASSDAPGRDPQGEAAP